MSSWMEIDTLTVTGRIAKLSKQDEPALNQDPNMKKVRGFKKLRYQREVSYLYQNLKYWVFVAVYRYEPMNLRIHIEMEGAQNTTSIWKRN